MLHRDKFVVLFVFLIILFSCKNEDKSKYYNNCLRITNQIFGIKDYEKVYDSIIDSVNNWKKNKLSSWINCSINKNIVIDSLLCFNIDKNKFVTAILAKSFYTQQQIIEDNIGDDEMDALYFFYGVRIKEKWYFFSGATCYLPRKNYQSDPHTPLSFAKLHEIAMKEVFSGYLIKKKKDVGFFNNIFAPEYKYEINDNFFSELDRIIRDAREQEEKYHGRKFLSNEDYMDWFAKSLVEANWQRK